MEARTNLSQNRDIPLENLRKEKAIKRWERRKQMLFQYEQGYEFSEFVDAISKAYGIKPEALKRDWGRRKKWLPLLAQIDDKKFRISKIVMRIRAIMNASWETYRSARIIVERWPLSGG